MKKNELGFGLIEVLVLLIVLGLTGFASWHFISNRPAQPGQITSKTSTSQSSTPSISAANSTQDLASKCGSQSSLDNDPACLFYNLPVATVSTVGHNTISFKELGIAMVVPDSIKTLTYRLDSSQTNAHNAVYTEVSVHLCSLGMLARVSGQPSTSDTNGTDTSYGVLVKQFPDFFIAYQHPQSACSHSKTRAEVIQNSNDLVTFKSSLASTNPL